jgi:AAA domain
MKGTFARPMPVENHPMYDRRYLVPSRPIAGMFARMKTSIRRGYTGTAFYGHTRWGKSRGMHYCARAFAREIPNLAILRLTAPENPSRSEDFFFSWLLEAASHLDTTSGRPIQKRRRLRQRLLELIDKSPRRLLLVFIDEAQRYDLIHWKWMKEVHEEIENAGHRVCFFLSGQPQLLHRKTEFSDTNPEIVARFFGHEEQFAGIRSVDELKMTLGGYDNSVFPPGTNWTFTRYFLRDAFDAELRLANEAQRLWDTFEEAFRLARFESTLELPMQNLTRAVEVALLDSMEFDDHDFHLTPAVWTEAVAVSGFIGDLQRLRMVVSDD